MGALFVTSHDHAAFQRACRERFHPSSLDDFAQTQRGAGAVMRQALFGILGGGGGVRWNDELIDGRSINNIVILRYDAVGDYVVSTMLISWLRQALPHARVDVISSFRNASLVAADPYVNWSHPIDSTQPLLHRSLVQLLRSMPDYEYDLLFCLPITRMSLAAVLARLVAPKAIKVALAHRNRQDIYGRVFDRLPRRPTWLEHWGETFLHFASDLVTPVVQVPASEIHPHVVLDEQGWGVASAFMKSEGLGFSGFSDGVVKGKSWHSLDSKPFDGEPYAVLNISAYIHHRQWNPAHCASVCRTLLVMYPDLRLYVTGSPAEADGVRRAVDLAGHPRCRVVLLKLTEFIGFIASARFVITPDTGTVHIAAATGRPVVGLYHEKIKACEWFPYGTRFSLVISPSEESVNFITPAEVVEATERLLSMPG